MAAFDPAVKKLLKKEGGYVFDPADRGGETKFGITKASYPNLDIKNLALEEAREIYLRDYWNPISLSQIGDQNVAEFMLDTAANSGTGTAGKMLQKAANILGARLTVDGAVGPLTVKAVNALNANALLSNMVSWRVKFYENIVAKDASQRKFLKGWLARAKSFAPAGAGLAAFLFAALGVAYFLSKRGAA
jgi:lysozyme family protein